MGVHHRRPDHKLLQEYAFCVYIWLVLCCVLRSKAVTYTACPHLYSAVH